MGIFRSETMNLYRLKFHMDERWKVMNQLGLVKNFHFIDLNKEAQPFDRLYHTNIKRLEESMQKICYLERLYEQFKIEMIPCKNLDHFQDWVKKTCENGKLNEQLLFDDLIKKELDTTVDFVRDQQSQLEKEFEAYKTIVYKMAVYERVQKLVGHNQYSQSLQALNKMSQNTDLKEGLLAENAFQTKYRGGIVNNSDMPLLRKLIIRATRCKVYVHSYSLDVQRADQFVEGSKNSDYHDQKQIYIVAYGAGSNLETKVDRVLKGFGSDSWELSVDEIQQELDSGKQEKNEKRDILKKSKYGLRDFLMKHLNDYKDFPLQRIYLDKLLIMREQAIYKHLNMFTAKNQVMEGVCWVPDYIDFGKEMQEIRDKTSAQGLTFDKGPDVIEGLVKPTLFQHNAFTEAFQMVVDTYGIPNYKEANPALLTIITFPFFFGVMYGDILHGLIILIFGMWLCLAKRENGNLAEMLGPGRYFVLLMGFFSTYCGFIYNDLTSMATESFGKSCYNVGNQMSADYKGAHDWVEAYYDNTGDLPYSQPPCTFTDTLCVVKDCVYKFGVDPIWYSSKEEITYLNSFKMKTSVIFGVWQMSMGTFLKGMNAVYNGHWIELIFVVFTQITLLMSLFGLMDTMIIVKWLTDWDAKGEQAPAIIQFMITMFIYMGKPQDPTEAKFIEGEGVQQQIQIFLLIVALITIPLMLFVEPYWWKFTHGRATAQVDGHQRLEAPEITEYKELLVQQLPRGGPKEHGFGEVFIHSMIETIEYSLGTVSNTASYLRLWALSLAHSQLAKVFFDYTISMMGLQPSPWKIPAMCCIYYLFMAVTFGVLIFMEGLGAFLHAIRLHWVEFQNKFYKGEGYSFKAFSFEGFIANQKNIQ